MKELDFLPGRLLFSKCDPFISSVSTIREFVRNADSQAYPRPEESETQQPGWAVSAFTVPPGNSQALRFENLL